MTETHAASDWGRGPAGQACGGRVCPARRWNSARGDRGAFSGLRYRVPQTRRLKHQKHFISWLRRRQGRDGGVSRAGSFLSHVGGWLRGSPLPLTDGPHLPVSSPGPLSAPVYLQISAADSSGLLPSVGQGFCVRAKSLQTPRDPHGL